MKSQYRGHRFPAEIISHAVWLYHRFTMSFRDVEDLLAERGIIVSYEAIRYWCLKFGPAYARNLRRKQGRLGEDRNTRILEQIMIPFDFQPAKPSFHTDSIPLF